MATWGCALHPGPPRLCLGKHCRFPACAAAAAGPAVMATSSDDRQPELACDSRAFKETVHRKRKAIAASGNLWKDDFIRFTNFTFQVFIWSCQIFANLR